jgi:hypothetical protein
MDTARSGVLSITSIPRTRFVTSPSQALELDGV